VGAFRAGITEAGMQSLDAAALMPSMAVATARRHGGWNAAVSEDARGCGWISATRTRYRDGGPGLDSQEIGACMQVGPVQVAAGAGRIETEQRWSLGGGSEVDGRYALLGVAMPLGPLQASLTGYRGRFDASTERRYANGTRVDASAARPEGDFGALVVRFDWTDAFRSGRLGLSPYLAGAWSASDVDAFAETGGGFPVAYGASAVDTREAALGVFADFHATGSTSVGLGLETSHRRVDSGQGVGARVIGLFDVPVEGSDTDVASSHLLFRARHDIGAAISLRAHARGAVDSRRRDLEFGLQLHASF
jgi:hypothetical protein